MTDTGTFTCAVCGGTFPKAWTDEEALAEYEATMPNAAARGDAVVLVCGVCYTPVVEFARAEGLEP